MAKKQAKDSVQGKGRMRVFFAEFEGSDETMQDGLRAIAAAVNKTFEPHERVIKVLTSQAENGENGEEESEKIIDDAIDESVEAETKEKARRVRKAPTMSIVKDLDLRPSEKQSLREFYEEKSPKSQYSEITVFLYYLQKILEIEGITPNHIFTCYKDVSKRSPKDLPQSIRNTASQKGWVDSSDNKALMVTNHGENHVEHDLPGSDD